MVQHQGLFEAFADDNTQRNFDHEHVSRSDSTEFSRQKSSVMDPYSEMLRIQRLTFCKTVRSMRDPTMIYQNLPPLTQLKN